MIPLADTHCHLLAGLDDGPRTPADALGMCRIAYDEGTRVVTALAHQNDEYPLNTPDRIRAAAKALREQLAAENVAVDAVPSAEVMVRPDLLDLWGRGELLTLGDTGKYILLEMPHGLTVNLIWMIEEFNDLGVVPVLAHAERCEDLIQIPGEVEKLIAAGCVIQVTSKALSKPPSSEMAAVLKAWFRRGIAHCLGSDGHSMRRRPPHLKAAYERVKEWAGKDVADRVGGVHGTRILRGEPLWLPPPEPPAKKWFGW